MNTIEVTSKNKQKFVEFIYNYSKDFGWKKSDISSLCLDDISLLAKLIDKKEI